MLGSGLMPKELNELSTPDLPHYPSYQPNWTTFSELCTLSAFFSGKSRAFHGSVTRVGDILNPTTLRVHNLSPQTHWENGCPTFGFCRNHSCIDIRIGFLPWSEENRIELHAVISLANFFWFREIGHIHPIVQCLARYFKL